MNWSEELDKIKNKKVDKAEAYVDESGNVTVTNNIKFIKDNKLVKR